MVAVNVLYAFDTRFWKLAAVSIRSLMASRNKDTQYIVHCMVAPHTRGRRVIEHVVRRLGGRLVWRVVRASENPFQTYDYSRWSPVIFYRLIAHRIFPHLDKILYLDSDTVVNDDLSDLYATDVSGFVMGAVRDVAPINNPDNKNGIYVREFSEKYLDGGAYFNSGVLLLNLSQMREHGDAALQTNVPLKYPDQDIINVAFRGHIKMLPLRYNFVPGVEIDSVFTGADADTTVENAAIMHFYAAKPYVYEYVPRPAYSAFYKNATALGLYPEDFIKLEIKHHKRDKESTRTVIPFVRLRRRGLYLFGLFKI